ncbi:MAG: hypothetical protein R2824_01860 [Saprospiraceae bacterium]|nr:hypothetical protein [Lewinella sp.]
MKSFSNTTKLCGLFLLMGLTSLQTNAQQTIIIRDGMPYCEADEILKLKIPVEHQEILNFIQSDHMCPNWIRDSLHCGRNRNVFRRASKDIYKDFQIAGLCFIPYWDILPDNPGSSDNNSCQYFQTAGMKIALVLWKPGKNGNPDEVVLLGFGEDANSIMQALSLRENGSRYFISKRYNRKEPLPTKAQNEVSASPYTESDKDYEVIKNSPEFDFVFLAWEDYWDLATSTAFYAKEERPRRTKGIIVERSGIILNPLLQDREEFKQLNHRTLLFRPDPPPKSVLVDSRSSIAYEPGDPCPPRWRDDLASTLKHNVADKMDKYRGNKVITIVGSPSNIGIGLNVGQKAPFDQISLNRLYFELGIEFFLKKPGWLSIETLIGRYNISDGAVYGINLLGRAYLPFPVSTNENNRYKIYANLGAGLYDFPLNLEAGVTAGAGLTFRPFSDLNFRLEAGAQYQNIDNIITKGSMPISYWSAKLGLKLLF